MFASFSSSVESYRRRSRQCKATRFLKRGDLPTCLFR